jgi:hypothetical protein
VTSVGEFEDAASGSDGGSGGYRRYTRSAISDVLVGEAETTGERLAEDAVGLDGQGWSIRQVADRFECSYGVTRRILRERVTLRARGGREFSNADGPSR